MASFLIYLDSCMVESEDPRWFSGDGTRISRDTSPSPWNDFLYLWNRGWFLAISPFPTHPLGSSRPPPILPLIKKNVRQNLEQTSCVLFKQEILFRSVIPIRHQVRKKRWVLFVLPGKTNTLWALPNGANPCLLMCIQDIVLLTNST